MADPKILLYDIESFPNLGYIWGKYEQNVVGQFVKERMMVSVAWRWFGEKKIHCLALPDFPSYKKHPEDNSALVKAFHKVISQADIVIGHNVRRFDDKMVNTEFVKHGLKPPPDHKVVDTLIAARTYFKFNSNRLNDLGILFGVGRKVKHGGFDLWVKCMRGDLKAWELMKKYNRNDITLLEKVYLKIRPWIKNHPDLTHYTGDYACSKCNSGKIRPKGFSYTATGKKQRYFCDNCGAHPVGRTFVSHSKTRGRL